MPASDKFLIGDAQSCRAGDHAVRYSKAVDRVRPTSVPLDSTAFLAPSPPRERDSEN